MVKTLHFLQGVQVQSLVGKLRSHVICSVGEKKKKKTKAKLKMRTKQAKQKICETNQKPYLLGFKFADRLFFPS